MKKIELWIVRDCLCATNGMVGRAVQIDRSRQQFSNSDGCYNLQGVHTVVVQSRKEGLFFSSVWKQ